MRLRSGGINTTWENRHIEKHKSVRWAERTPSWFVHFDLQIFSGGVYPPPPPPPPRAQPHAQSLFSISNSFWYKFDLFFWSGEGWCSRKFDRLFRCFDPLSRHLTEAKRKTQTERVGTVEEGDIFWQRKVRCHCEFQCHNGDHLRKERWEVWREKRKVRIFGQF